VIGRCVFAKKIYKASDCDSDRERMYWDQIKLPFIYGKFRLFDGAGHPSAIAAAASIRDMLHAGEDILIRFSIEGATLQRKGNVLEKSVARKVAATWKPCNKSANSGVIADPNGPPLPVRDDVVTKKEHEHPGFMKLGGEHEFRGSPILKDEGLEKGVKHALAAGALAATLATTPAQSFVREPPAPAAPAPAQSSPSRWARSGRPWASTTTCTPSRIWSRPSARTSITSRTRRASSTPPSARSGSSRRPRTRSSSTTGRSGSSTRNWSPTRTQFLSTLRANPSFYNTVASSHWNRLKQSLGGHRDRAAYGWRWGKGAALSATDEEVQADPYVQKYVALAGAPQGRPGPQATMHLQKDALAAGNYDAAPGTLTGGAALMREDRAGRARSLKARRYHLNGARAALRDWDRQDDFRKFLKTRLPDADPSFIEHFSDMVDNLKLHKREADQPKPQAGQEAEAGRQQGPGDARGVRAAPAAAGHQEGEVPACGAAAAQAGPRAAPEQSLARVHGRERRPAHRPGRCSSRRSRPRSTRASTPRTSTKAILNPYDESLAALPGRRVAPTRSRRRCTRLGAARWSNWMVGQQDAPRGQAARLGHPPRRRVLRDVAEHARPAPGALLRLPDGPLEEVQVDISKPMSRAMLARLRQGISSNMRFPSGSASTTGRRKAMRSEKNKERRREPQRQGRREPHGADGKRLTHLDKPHPDLMTEDQRWPGHPVSDMRANDPPQIQGLTAHHTWLPHLANWCTTTARTAARSASMLMRMKAQHEPGEQVPDCRSGSARSSPATPSACSAPATSWSPTGT
jgi:hypothetical protein